MPENTSNNTLWFNPKALEALTDMGTFDHGRALYIANKVLDLHIHPEEDYWRLEGQVQGTQRAPYTVTVELSLTPEGNLDSWDSDCSCPMGYDCKHGVALSMKAAYHGLRMLGPEKAYAVTSKVQKPPTPEEEEALRREHQARVDEAMNQQAEAQLFNWLRELDHNSGESHAASPQALHSDKEPEQYLYLLKVVGNPNQPPQLKIEAGCQPPKCMVAGQSPKPSAPNPTRAWRYTTGPA